MAKRTGKSHRLYYNAGTFGAPDWTLINNISDANRSLSKGEADASDRDGNDYVELLGTLKTLEVGATIQYDPSKATTAVLEDAFHNNTVLDILALDGDEDVEGSRGVRAGCEVFSFEMSEGLNDPVTVEVMLKPSGASTFAPYVYVVGSGS